MIAKRASILRELHALLRGDSVDKRYLALVAESGPHIERGSRARLRNPHFRLGSALFE